MVNIAMSRYPLSPSMSPYTRGTAARKQHATRDHTGGGEWNADKAVSATATQPETYGSGAAYDDACFFFVRLTLSRLSTCSSVWELSMICQGKGKPGWALRDLHARAQAQPLARNRLPPEQWPQRSCKCWLGRTLGKSSGRAG